MPALTGQVERVFGRAYAHTAEVLFVAPGKMYRDWRGHFVKMRDGVSGEELLCIVHRSHVDSGAVEAGHFVGFDADSSGKWLIVGPFHDVEEAGQVRDEIEQHTISFDYLGQSRERDNGEIAAKLLMHRDGQECWVTVPDSVLMTYMERVGGSAWRFGDPVDPGAETGGGYYGVLGVSENASQAQIKAAFRKLALQHHPDRGGDAARFREINEAYEALGDSRTRAKLDLLLHAARNGVDASRPRGVFRTVLEYPLNLSRPAPPARCGVMHASVSGWGNERDRVMIIHDWAVKTAEVQLDLPLTHLIVRRGLGCTLGGVMTQLPVSVLGGLYTRVHRKLRRTPVMQRKGRIQGRALLVETAAWRGSRVAYSWDAVETDAVVDAQARVFLEELA